jgi:hypothetical protein
VDRVGILGPGEQEDILLALLTPTVGEQRLDDGTNEASVAEPDWRVAAPSWVNVTRSSRYRIRGTWGWIALLA